MLFLLLIFFVVDAAIAVHYLEWPPQSGVWDVLDSISEKFLVPLRDVLTTTQAHCRNETKLKKEELQTARCGSGRGNSEGSGKGLKMDGPEMTVQLVGGELLPEPNLDEQMQVRRLLYTNLKCT